MIFSKQSTVTYINSRYQYQIGNLSSLKQRWVFNGLLAFFLFYIPFRVMFFKTSTHHAMITLYLSNLIKGSSLVPPHYTPAQFNYGNKSRTLSLSRTYFSGSGRCSFLYNKYKRSDTHQSRLRNLKTGPVWYLRFDRCERFNP